MYCVQCGSKLTESVRFCHNCGQEVMKNGGNQNSPTPETLPNSGPFSPDHQDSQAAPSASGSSQTRQVWGNPTSYHSETASDHLSEADMYRLFVGYDKYSYFNNKWNNGKKVSWNWAAFFFPTIWLGYRKMYAHLFILLGVYLAVTLLIYLLVGNIGRAGYGLTFAYALYGNYWYKKHADKKIHTIQQKYPSDQVRKAEIERQGGTSVLGIFGSIGLNLLFVVVLAFTIYAHENNLASSKIDTSDSSFAFSDLKVDDGNIVFGTDTDDSGVTGITDTFEEDEPIYIQADFGKKIGSSEYRISIVKDDYDTEEQVTTWTDDIDPTWNGYFNNLYDPEIDDYYLDAGDYIVRIFDKHDDLLVEGTFTVETSDYNTY